MGRRAPLRYLQLAIFTSYLPLRGLPRLILFMEHPDPSLDAVYAYVEKAYLRMQAGDVLVRCLEEESTIPMQQVVEGLVLAGPQSIAILREMLAESSQRKSQVQDDMHQVYV